LRDLIEHGLEQIASLWPGIERAYKWIHPATHILNNHEDEAAATVQRRFNGMVGAMARHRDRAGSLSDAIDHFGKVTRSYRPGLFHCYAVPDLPHTNNDLEHEFGSQRYHERRATGRKTASPAAVLRGEARLVAAIATRQRAPSGSDLGCVIGNSGKSSGSVSIGGARRISCAPASGVIPPPIWRHWRKRLAS